MRSNLTFLGFLRQYVKELSGESTHILQKKLSICGLSLKKMQKSPFQNLFRQTESSQSPDESSHSLD
jgi:hypothetical protein